VSGLARASHHQQRRRGLVGGPGAVPGGALLRRDRGHPRRQADPHRRSQRRATAVHRNAAPAPARGRGDRRLPAVDRRALRRARAGRAPGRALRAAGAHLQAALQGRDRLQPGGVRADPARGGGQAAAREHRRADRRGGTRGRLPGPGLLSPPVQAPHRHHPGPLPPALPRHRPPRADAIARGHPPFRHRRRTPAGRQPLRAVFARPMRHNRCPEAGSRGSQRRHGGTSAWSRTSSRNRCRAARTRVC